MTKAGLPTGRSDTDLVLAVREGGFAAERAYADLLARHRGAVFAATKGWFAPGNTHQDVFQAAMVGLWEAALSWDGRQPFRGWVGFVARRKVITLVKEATRAKHDPLRGYATLQTHSQLGPPLASIDHEPGRRFAAPEPAWEGGLPAVESAEAFKDLFTQARLTPLEAAVLAKWLDGYSYEEIGDRRQVDNALQRAKRKTKAWIEQQWLGDL